MGKIAVTKTELIWPGKYNEDGAHTETLRVRLPFHISECLSAGKAGERGDPAAVSGAEPDEAADRQCMGSHRRHG